MADRTVPLYDAAWGQCRPGANARPGILMPAVLREGPYRFFFYSGDGDEPQHVHVMRDERVAKFWLDPVRMQRSGGMRPLEVRRVQRIIEANRSRLMDAWDDYFND